MRLSKKEKILICILGILVVGYLYYEFGYLKQKSRVNTLSSEKKEVETKYNSAINTIALLEDKKEQQKILLTKVSDKSSIFYPLINQENLIIELSSLLNNSNLEGTLKFEEIEVKEIEGIEKKQKSLKESSILPIAEKYKSTLSSSDIQNDISNKDKNVINDEKKSGNENNNSNDNQNIDSNSILVEQLKCELNFTGTYSSLNDFLKALSLNSNKIVVKSIIIGEKSLDMVNGVLNLEFYAIPKLDEKDVEEYLKWENNNTYGKESPFAVGAATGTLASVYDFASDFSINVRSNKSVLPSVIMYKSDDDIKNTYIYSNKNDEEKIQLSIIEENGEYYYQYSTSNDSYPKGGNKKIFIPTSENIVIDVTSENRTDDDDKSAINLNISNNTDKLIDINISDDDVNNPRVTITGDGNKISINKK